MKDDDITYLQLNIIRRKTEYKLRQLESAGCILESELEARIQELDWFLKRLDKLVKSE